MTHNGSLEVLQLATLNIDALREIWRGRYGAPPAIRSGDLMRRLLAEKLQSSDTDACLERRLTQLARSHSQGRPLTPSRPRFKPGTLLSKSHAGQIHLVEVLTDGFRWNDRTWKSLSQIAREITGVRWNGPRFFGLRDDA